MADRIEVVSQQGWFSRIGGAFKGILVGLLMFFAAVPLLFWNEGRAVQTYKSLKEGAGAVVSAQSAPHDAGLDGKLVHLIGEATVDAPVRDPVFGFEQRGLRLERTVEMFQWQESSSTREEKKLGGGVERITTYSYDTGWSERLEDASDFHEPAGHQNPSSMPFESERFAAASGRLGDYRLDNGVLGQVGGWQDLAVGPEILAETVRTGFVSQGGWLVRGSDPARPAVGDVRVRFRFVPEQTISVIARQSGDRLEAYQTEAGDALLMVSEGAVPAAQMFESAQAANTTLTWIIRGGGFLLMWIGLGLVFKPLSVLADVVPFAGTLVAKGLGFVAFIMAAITALVVIAVAWIVYRPLLAIGLLAAVVGLIVWLASRKRKPVAAPAPA